MRNTIIVWAPRDVERRFALLWLLHIRVSTLRWGDMRALLACKTSQNVYNVYLTLVINNSGRIWATLLFMKKELLMTCNGQIFIAQDWDVTCKYVFNILYSGCSLMLYSGRLLVKARLKSTVSSVLLIHDAFLIRPDTHNCLLADAVWSFRVSVRPCALFNVKPNYESNVREVMSPKP